MKRFDLFLKKRVIFTRIIILAFGMFYYTTISFAQNYNPDFFPIGVWSVRGDFRPVDDFLFNRETAASFHHTSFKNLHNQGFNSVYLSYDPIVNTLDTILSIAELNEMKIIANMNNLNSLIGQSNNITVTSSDIIQAIENDSISLLKKSPATLGYYLYDEPLQGWIDFDVLENAKNILTNLTSDSPHPILSTWNNETQMSYIDSYLNLDVLMMDAYPFEDGDVMGDLSEYMPSAFVSNPIPYSDYINAVRENHCESQNRPLWVVLQAFGDLEAPENGGYWRQVYPKEIRLQVYLSLMQGAKGIWYFLYESEYPYLLGMLDVSGQPTQRLLEVMEVNKEVEALSGILLKLSVYADQTAVSIDAGEVKLHFDNTSDNQDKYIIAVNTDVFSISNPTITVKKSDIGYNVLSVQNVYSGQNIAFSETSSEINITLPIDAGSGVLLHLSNEAALSVDGSNFQKQIQIYPNPVSNNLYIHHDYISIDSYELYNTLGKLQKKGKLNEGNSIDTRLIKQGVYYLKLCTKYGSFTKVITKI